MTAKLNSRNWNDVQTAIATIAIVTTLGLWNLFATPSKTEIAQTNEPVSPPADPQVESIPAVMPQVKIMFTPMAALPQTTVVQQVQTNKKKNKNNNGNSSGGSVTQTKTS